MPEGSDFLKDFKNFSKIVAFSIEKGYTIIRDSPMDNRL